MAKKQETKKVEVEKPQVQEEVTVKTTPVVEQSKTIVSEPLDYEKLAIIIADKIGLNSQNKSDTSAGNLILQ